MTDNRFRQLLMRKMHWFEQHRKKAQCKTTSLQILRWNLIRFEWIPDRKISKQIGNCYIGVSNASNSAAERRVKESGRNKKE